MAFYGQQRKMVEGQFTQTIYGAHRTGLSPCGTLLDSQFHHASGLIRDQKFAEAIQHLNIELQVGTPARQHGVLITYQYCCLTLSPSHVDTELSGQPRSPVPDGVLQLPQWAVRTGLPNVRVIVT